MNEREKLIHLIKQAEKKFSDIGKPVLDIEEYVADYLLQNGVSVHLPYEDTQKKSCASLLPFRVAYVDIPINLTEKTIIDEYGIDAFRYYNQRLQERRRQGRMYNNSLKTIYIWAAQDRKTHQGFYSTYRGANRSKHKNHGGS